MTIRDLQKVLDGVENKDASIAIETGSGLYVLLESVVAKTNLVVFKAPEGFELTAEIQGLLSK